MENKDNEGSFSPKAMETSEFEESNQFNFTQKYNQMCRTKIEKFLDDCNELYAGFTQQRDSFEKLVKLDQAQNKGRFKRHHIKRRTATLTSDDNEKNVQKVKLYNTLAEFVLLTQNSKPKVFKFNGEEGSFSPKQKIPTRPPPNKLQEMANQRHLSQGEPDLEKENEGVNNIQPSGWGDIGSLFFQGDQNNESKTRQGQHIIEINHDPNTEDDNNDNFINISDTGNSFEYSADENEGSETSFNSPQSSFFKATSTPLSRKTKTNDASRQHQKYIYSNKTINKKKITSSLKQSLNRKSESQAFWKSHLLENQSELDPSKYHLISPDDRISENPSLDTIKRSLSQINLNKQRSSYHKRFLSKPSLSISRINSSAYYKRKGNLIKMKLVNLNKESLETSQLRRKSISKSRITKPHTIQHKSSKVHPVKLHKSRIKKEIERAKEAGHKILEKDIMYKYKVSNSKLEGVSSQNPTTAGQSGVQNLLYLQNEEEYNHIMVDYDDKAFNDKQIGFSKDFKSPHTLVSSTSNDIDPGRRRVKTPIDPNEEFKREQREGLRTSGSYSIESLRNHQNGPLILSKLESSGRITHNTNHLKVKGSRYPQKTSKLSSNICTVDGLGNDVAYQKFNSYTNT
ncbi:unnamed protein product [Moneuplotes crassus]|uniref:Uncharacterized protein n=1 Tax=Euplotes crassus TaxID=5936 RepID=A0AAD1XBA6_EUPCR|nr:unnamed protein product [Moneuplotes crassus]